MADSKVGFFALSGGGSTRDLAADRPAMPPLPRVTREGIPGPAPPSSAGAASTGFESVTVARTESRKDAAGQFTAYLIDVQTTSNRWTRFGSLPREPPKKSANKFDVKLVETRRAELEAYLGSLIREDPRVIVTSDFYAFLEVHLYDKYAVCYMLRHNLLPQAAYPFPFPLTPTMLVSLEQRRRDMLPKYRAGDDLNEIPDGAFFGLAMLYRSVRLAKMARVSAGFWQRAEQPLLKDALYTEPVFDIGIFEDAQGIELSEVDLGSVRGLAHLQRQVTFLECHCSLSSLQQLLIQSVTLSTSASVQANHTWERLMRLKVDGNQLTSFDESTKRAPNVMELDASYNLLMSVDNLRFWGNLTNVNLSNNRLVSLDNFSAILPTVKILNLSRNHIESLRGLDGLLAVKLLDLSFNLVGEINETNRLGTLPTLEDLILQGNPLANTRNYRSTIFARFGDRHLSVRLDGERPQPRELPLIKDEIERMNRVKARSSVPDFSANGGQSAPAAPVSPTRGASSARATARPRLAKQKIAVKSVGDGAGGLIRRIAEIHPPATSKRDLFGPAHFVVREPIHIDPDDYEVPFVDVEMIKKRFNIKETVRLYESTEVAAASTSTANWMSMMRELDSLPAMTYHMQQAAAAAPEDAPPTQTHSSAVPKFSGKQLNIGRSRSSFIQSDGDDSDYDSPTTPVFADVRRQSIPTTPLSPPPPPKPVPVQVKASAFVEELARGLVEGTIQHLEPFDFAAGRHVAEEQPFEVVLSLDWRRLLLVEVDAEAGSLGRTWPLSLIASPDDAAICENTKEGADPLEETSTFSLSVGRGDGRVVFGLCGRQTFVNVSLLLNALRKADLTAAMSPTSRRRADLPPASATASSVDLGDVTLTSFAAGAVGLAESAVLFADWMPVWVYGTDELVSSALVVVAADGVHAFSVAAAVKNGEKPEATLVAFSPFSLVKSILVGLFHQLLRLEGDAITTMTLITCSLARTQQLIDVIRPRVMSSSKVTLEEQIGSKVEDSLVRHATSSREVLDELSTYLSGRAAGKDAEALRILAYIIVRDNHDRSAAPLRSLLMTASTIYLVDEDYARWPTPCFASTYDYKRRPPYRVVAERPISAVLAVETPANASSEISLVFEDPHDGKQLDFQTASWDLMCALPMLRDRFARQLGTIWNEMFSSELRIISA